MEGKFDELQLAFIDDQLDQHGEYVRDLLMEAIEARDLIKGRGLMEGIAWRVGRKGINPHLEIMFPDYGRFIEINYFKRRKSNNTLSWIKMSEDANSAVLGQRMRKKPQRRKKDTRFYAATVYGSLNTLISKIMYEYTDAEMERMKQVVASGYNMKGN